MKIPSLKKILTCYVLPLAIAGGMYLSIPNYAHAENRNITKTSLENKVSKSKEVISEGKYIMGDMDTKKGAREHALMEAKRNALEQVGTYIESYSEVQNYKLTKDQIESIASGNMSVKILEEKWELSGENLMVKVKIQANVNTSSLEERISALKEEPNSTSSLLDKKIQTSNTEECKIKQLTFNDDYDSEPAWLPDGEGIVFASDRNGGSGIFEMSKNGEGIAKTSSGGSPYRTGGYVLKVINGSMRAGHPTLSPDGTKIAFHACPNNEEFSAIYTANRGTGSNMEKFLTRWSLMRCQSNPEWVSDQFGEKIIFEAEWGRQTNYQNPQRDLLVEYSSTNKKIKKMRFWLTDETPGNEEHPTWSPEGTKVAFVLEDEIYIADAKGDKKKKILSSDPNICIDIKDLAWSPDGKKIAFASDMGKSDKYDIYVIGIDGNNIKRLTNNPSPDIKPAWSPDGKKIAFASDRDGDYEIYVIVRK